MSPITERITPIVRLRRFLHIMTLAGSAAHRRLGCAAHLRATAALALATFAVTAAITRPALAGGHTAPNGNVSTTVAGQGGGTNGGGGGTGVGGGERGRRDALRGIGYGTGGGTGMRGTWSLPPTTTHSWTSGFPTCPPPIASPAAWQRFFMFYSQYVQTLGTHRLPFEVWLVLYTPVEAKDLSLYVQMYVWYVRYTSMPARGHAR